jgi:dCTP deaminase
MGIAGKDRLEELIKRFEIIEPFSPNLLDGDSYILTVKEDVTLNYLQHKNVVANEIVFVPPAFVAHRTAKTKFGRMGLSFLNAAKVHSGWVGRLVLEVVNLSDDKMQIMIKRGEPFMHIELITRDGKPAPYEGEYMFQNMNAKEIEHYAGIMANHFKEFFDLNALEKMKETAMRKVLF